MTFFLLSIVKYLQYNLLWIKNWNLIFIFSSHYYFSYDV